MGTLLILTNWLYVSDTLKGEKQGFHFTYLELNFAPWYPISMKITLTMVQK